MLAELGGSIKAPRGVLDRQVFVKLLAIIHHYYEVALSLKKAEAEPKRFEILKTFKQGNVGLAKSVEKCLSSVDASPEDALSIKQYIKSICTQLEVQDEYFLASAEEILRTVNVTMEIFGASCETHLFDEQEPITNESVALILGSLAFVPQNVSKELQEKWVAPSLPEDVYHTSLKLVEVL